MLFTRRLLIVGIALLTGSPVFSQSDKTFVKGTFKEEQSLIYKKDWALGLNLHSNGYGANFIRGQELTVTEKFFYEVDGVAMKHPKEYSTSSNYDSGESYVYGKLNTLITIRTGVGFQNAIFPKAEKGGVEIRYLYSGGLSWGLAKPVYLEIYDAGSNSLKTERFDASKDGYDNIYGTASFFQGIGQTRIYPGIYAKAGLNFEFGPYDDTVRTLEVGAVFDAYAQEVPIFAVIDGIDVNKRTFLSFYVSVSWGKRW